MCRKSKLQGCCLIALGLGVLIGHSLESVFICFCGGVGLVVFGFFVMGRR